MSTLPKEMPLEDVNNQSFWMPGNYQCTVRRTEESFQACNDVVACFQERARVERQYAQQLSEWSSKWKPLVDTSPLYGSLLRAWQCFLSSADRLSVLHSSICRSLVSEDGDRVRTWQKETFHKKIFGGFRESHDFDTGFARAQKPWAKRLKKLEKARGAYHKASRKAQAAQDRETHAKGNPDYAIEKQKKIQEEREEAIQEKEKVRERYEKVLEEVTRYAPRYMEEMESIFDQSQEEERKRISFLKQAFLSIHRHLDVTNNESVKAVYSELHHTLMSINEQDDLRWWKNNHGPGMPTDWPHFQEWIPPEKKKKGKKEIEEKSTLERNVMISGVRVRALYDYMGQEPDELSFKAETAPSGRRQVLIDQYSIFQPMEFACGFVYVPPLTNQRSAQRPNPNFIKRSALLPPLKILHPRGPPPPPPATSKEPHSPPGTSPEKRIMGHMGVNEDLKGTGNNLPRYENVAFNLKAKTSSPVPKDPGRPHAPQSSPAVVRKALLPPPLRASLSPPAPASQLPKGLHPNSELLRSQEQGLTYDIPKEEPDTEEHLFHSEYSYNIPEGSGMEMSHLLSVANSKLPLKSVSPPPLPPRPSFMKRVPEYLLLLPRSSTPTAPPVDPPAPAFILPAPQDNQPLPGNPNVILVSLGTLVTEENVCTMQGVPASCSQCGSALDSFYDNMVDMCYFCQTWDPATSPASQLCAPMGCQNSLFLLDSDETAKSPAESLLIFCIDISGSMCITSQVTEGGQVIYKSRLQCVQQAVLQCVRCLSDKEPHTRVGLITFNNQVTLHGHGTVSSQFVRGAELIESEYLEEVALGFPSPPPLSESREHLEGQIHRLVESGATALGPAALIAIAMASRQPGSKVVICTDGKANTELGNLDVDDSDSHLLASSIIFYQDLGDYAANKGVSVSVLSIEGTDCRLSELGKLADRTGGKVVIASPDKLHTEFQQVVERRTVATHCNATLLLPTVLTVKGEREPGHKGIREVGNVTAGKEITFQFQAREQDTQTLLPGGCVSVQLQIRYRRMDGQTMLRVLSLDRRVTEDSSLVLSSLNLSVLQLNSSQFSAALAMRGRYTDAQSEGETQRKLMEKALNHTRGSEEKEQHKQWVQTMDPIYNNIYNFTRSNYVSPTDTQSLTDTGAVLLYAMKNGNRKSISSKGGTTPCQ